MSTGDILSYFMKLFSLHQAGEPSQFYLSPGRSVVRSLIIIPTYNEFGNIASLTREILRAAHTTDILIIDDNSPDGTGRLVDQLAAQNSRISVIHRPGKLGYGTAYVQGFKYALERGYDAVFQMDADFSHDPECIPEFLQVLEKADLVIGSRYVNGGKTPNWGFKRKMISFSGNLFVRLMLGIPVRDCTSGFRCYRAKTLRSINWNSIKTQGYAFQTETAYLLWKRGFRIVEMPITFENRSVGASKMSRKIAIEAARWVTSTRLNAHRYDGLLYNPETLQSDAPDAAVCSSGAGTSAK